MPQHATTYTELTPEQIAQIITPLVHGIYQRPEAQDLTRAAELYITRAFLTTTKHQHTNDPNNPLIYTRERHKLEDYQTVHAFLQAPAGTDMVIIPGQGIARPVITHYKEFKNTFLRPYVEERIQGILNQLRTQPGEHHPDLAQVAQRQPPPGEHDADLLNAINDALYDSPYHLWRTRLEWQDLAGVIERHADTIRLEREEAKARHAAYRAKARVNFARAEELLSRLGLDALRHYGDEDADQAWSVILRAIEKEGATLDEAHALIYHLRLSNLGRVKVRLRLERLARKRSN